MYNWLKSDRKHHVDKAKFEQLMKCLNTDANFEKHRIIGSYVDMIEITNVEQQIQNSIRLKLKILKVLPLVLFASKILFTS